MESIPIESLYKFKVIHTLNVVGQSVLLEVYQQTKLFPNSKSIKDHLMQDLSWSNSRFRDNFDKTMRYKIENTDKSGKEYDISLQAKCLKVLSQHYEPNNQDKWTNILELEGKCKALKDKRNETFHSISGISNREMIAEIEVIKKLLMDILTNLKVQFPYNSSEIGEIMKSVNDQISDIITHPLIESQNISVLVEKARQNLQNEIQDYKTRCKEWGKLKILDFLLGCSTFHSVKLLFTEVVVEKSDKLKQNKQVNCKDIFLLASETSILLIDSEAGGGKTTIFRYGINDWGEDGHAMNTEDYDFIFPMLFRNPHISSVEGLLEMLIPNVSNKINMKYIMKCLKDPSQSILFFCDGYDEKNENSSKLFNEICELKKIFPHIRVIATSRPESVKEFYLSFGTEYSIDHLKVLGIHKDKRGEFLSKYHNELATAGVSNQSSRDLLDFYESCSARHQELYRLPINLVILAWLWGQDKKKAKSIKTAAGLYTAIVDILNKKLINRILKNHPKVMNRLEGDIGALNDVIDRFKEKMYKESFLAVRNDRIYIDDDGVKMLRTFCKNEGLPFIELKGAYLLSKLEWENVDDLKEILEFPHKGFLDYYSAKFIQSKVNQKAKEFECQPKTKVTESTPKSKEQDSSIRAETNVEKRSKFKIFDLFRRKNRSKENRKEVDMKGKDGKKAIGVGNSRNSSLKENRISGSSTDSIIREIILENYGQDFENLNWSKYQNILQLLGGVLALKGGNLVEEYGSEIIDLLIETGVRNNSQWFDIYSDFNLNDVASAKFGRLIAPHIVLGNFTITNSDVEVLSTLLQYLNINHVTLTLSNTAVPAGLPSLIHILRNKECNVTMSAITDEHVDLWNSNASKFALIQANKIVINEDHGPLPFLSFSNKIDELRLQNLWRNNYNTAAPNMSGCKVKKLWTSVNKTDDLPITIEYLMLRIMVDHHTLVALDPGLSKFSDHCPHLRELNLHIVAGAVTEHLHKSDSLGYRTSLYLSNLNTNQDVEWAVNTARSVQPSSGYRSLVLPRCDLSVMQLCNLMHQIAAEGIMVCSWVVVIGPLVSDQEMQQLQDASDASLHCDFHWYPDEDKNSISMSIW